MLGTRPAIPQNMHIQAGWLSTSGFHKAESGRPNKKNWMAKNFDHTAETLGLNLTTRPKNELL